MGTWLTYTFDAIENGFHRFGSRRFATGLILAFLLTLVVVELRRQDLLPAALAWVPTSHFAAVSVAMTVLLAYEVASLIFAIPRSTTNMVGKQFEVLALILLRKAITELEKLPEPLEWESVRATIITMSSEAVGALVIFVVLGFYYRVARNIQPIFSGPTLQNFIRDKKGVALLLLIGAIVLVVQSVFAWQRNGMLDPLFVQFYTLLVFGDVLLVLVSLRYSDRFGVVFRNTAFVIATVFIRFSLVADGWLAPVIAVAAAVYALGVAYAYNRFNQVLEHAQP
jgi:hypothetical protein